MLGGAFTVLADASSTGGAVGAVDQTLPAGMVTPLHRHPEAETFVLLEGSIRALVEGAVHDAAAGDVVHIPSGAVHAFGTGPGGARLIGLSSPAGHEEFFRAAGVPAQGPGLPPAGPPDMDRLMAAAAAHGVEILGPPPAELA
jgi:quercetin dioxygenase-like cupin family protein